MTNCFLAILAAAGCGASAPARLGEHVKVDLWRYKGERKGGKPLLRAALEFLAPYADAGRKWPHKQITKRNPAQLLALLRRG
jgi:hypothetical protein